VVGHLHYQHSSLLYATSHPWSILATDLNSLSTRNEHDDVLRNYVHFLRIWLQKNIDQGIDNVHLDFLTAGIALKEVEGYGEILRADGANNVWAAVI
jgi:hypothetical protein